MLLLSIIIGRFIYKKKRPVKYFKEQAGESGIPYQNLMNMYLTDCAKKKKKPHIVWE